MRQRDYLCMFRSKFDVMLKLSDAGLREITQAMFDYLEEKEPVFTDVQAQALWWSWSLEFKAQEKKAEEVSERKKRNGKLGGRPKKDEIEKQMVSEKANGFFENQKKQMVSEKANGFLKSYTDNSIQYTETDTETENIVIENNNIKGTPTLDDVLKFAKDPSVALSQEEARKFYDHYTAQSWLRSNGQQIPNNAPALICALRIWKSNQGKFDKPLNSSPARNTPEYIRESINANKKLFIRLFNARESHLYGDYDSDPPTFDKWSEADVVIRTINTKPFDTLTKIYKEYITTEQNK